ncbi:hypothetical protein RRG08_001657 [Elysia crispata]|uniref:Uncharacterized protein n=1 Tax=Elysia crispata TaxID=231223 RepID=A0AAE1AM63_9GAST|nr:hypothetical protein RRG08_001657 [Elysia crispata]
MVMIAAGGVQQKIERNVAGTNKAAFSGPPELCQSNVLKQARSSPCQIRPGRLDALHTESESLKTAQAGPLFVLKRLLTLTAALANQSSSRFLLPIPPPLKSPTQPEASY